MQCAIFIYIYIFIVVPIFVSLQKGNANLTLNSIHSSCDRVLIHIIQIILVNIIMAWLGRLAYFTIPITNNTIIQSYSNDLRKTMNMT